MPKLLNCTSCSAPLDVSSMKTLTIRCSFCGNSMIWSEEHGGSKGAESRAVKSSVGSMLDKSLKLAEVVQLVHGGNKIEAIKLYRETFGVGLKEAKEAVEKIERGESVNIGDARVEAQRASFSLPLSANDPGLHIVRHISRAITWLIIGFFIVAAVIAIIVGTRRSEAPKPPQVSIAIPERMIPPSPASPSSPSAPSAPAFANPVLEFGSEGIGAGQFKDARSVTVDGEGRIYVGEYTGGRVQVFDLEGKFLTQWMVDTKRVLLGMAADRKGTVYVVHPGQLLRYEGPTGNLLGEMPRRNSVGINESYSDVFVALDGSIYAIGGHYNIVRISPNGEIKTVVDVRARLEENISLNDLAVDGMGNIYTLGTFDNTVYKFGPDGKFINRFGGRGDQAGQLRSPDSVAVDGQGRVYVSDAGRSIQVFDANGRYLDSFGGREVIFGIAINDKDEIFVSQRNRAKIIKYVLNKRQ